ncbi:MAG TPA: pyridoxine 5'-phosphate synthase [Fulvivirga sp.]|nr:pyridoxine 5'-phosphate synthase [Fulvivirga sp.]
MTRLSVNINKIATLRNARGGNNPDLIKTALDCERFGAQGITVHPRPDERHIKYNDVFELKKVVTTEFNIEGFPDQRFMDMVLKVKPDQVTLVPDAPDAITSNAGWDTIKHKTFLKEIIESLKAAGIRTSIFIDTNDELIEGAAAIGTERVELYTEAYAKKYLTDRVLAIKPYINAADVAHKNGLDLNAGHDLDLDNLRYLCEQIPAIEEVSIGHALICDALYLGLENTIRMYLREVGH